MAVTSSLTNQVMLHLILKYPSSPSYALAALTRLDHSSPLAVSGRGIMPGSSLLRGGSLSLTSVRESSDAESGTVGRQSRD